MKIVETLHKDSLSSCAIIEVVEKRGLTHAQVARLAGTSRVWLRATPGLYESPSSATIVSTG